MALEGVLLLLDFGARIQVLDRNSETDLQVKSLAKVKVKHHPFTNLLLFKCFLIDECFITVTCKVLLKCLMFNVL